MRFRRIEAGLLGDWQPVGDGVSELRVDCGSGCRHYYTLGGQVVVIRLCDSDKSGQQRAINHERELAKSISKTRDFLEENGFCPSDNGVTQ